MTPVELVRERYGLPFEFYRYQATTINDLAPLERTGHYLAVGVGKTATSTGCCLYKLATNEIDHAIVLMPPILLDMWDRWLNSIRGTSSMIYRGTPKQRGKLKLNTDFILMSYQIFKKDQERLVFDMDPRRIALVCDEATAIKNHASDTYRTVRAFSLEGHLMLLTGTPLGKIEDAYGYISLMAPGLYRNYNQFRNLHIADEDQFDRPTAFKNLELLERNMRINAVRLLKEDVLDQLPEITYTPIHYELDPRHSALYTQLVEQELIEFSDGSKIDVTTTTALWHATQQIIMNWGHFGDDPRLRPAAYDLIDQTMDELHDKKLIIFTNYRMTSESVYAYCKERWGATLIYGGVRAQHRQPNIDMFMEDPNCRVMVAQMQSAGYGLNPQAVCADVLFLEQPLSPIQFEQAVGRVYRNGQPNKAHARIEVANHTIQVHLLNQLMRKDALVNTVVRNYQDIRAALYGQ